LLKCLSYGQIEQPAGMATAVNLSLLILSSKVLFYL